MSSFVTLKFDPDARTLRQFGFIALLFFSGLAAALYFGWVATGWSVDLRNLLGGVAASVGLLSGLFSLFKPKYNRVLFVGMSLVAYPIGTVVSFVVLGIVFYLVIGPVALIQRALGRDALGLGGRTDPSAWQKAEKQKSDASYFQQF